MASSNSSTYILDLDELSAGLKAACTAKNETPCATHSQDDAKQQNRVNSPEVSIKASSVSTPMVYDRWTLLYPSSINFGPFSSSSALPCPSSVRSGDDEQQKQETFYITTAINYTNGPAHMGHAYEATTSDCIARYARLSGKYPGGVYFVTGSDEHGQKIATTAEKEGRSPLDVCNTYVAGFQCLNQRMRISNNDYIRTTSEKHKRTARQLWQLCADAGDIYLDTYEGWYNVREETFVSDTDAAATDYKDPTSGSPLAKMKEESYFFKMSKYHSRLVEHMEQHKDFVQPENFRKFILARLSADSLRDLSISRKTFDWGISVPHGFDEKHVMYVWVDALSNYLTGVDALRVNNNGGEQDFLYKLWPANVHIIGKDILWFHVVIWPCLLMSANIPLPKAVFAHGFVNDKEGKKMSKSVGNVVDPHDMLDKYSVDTFRWYLCKESPYGGELSFSEESLRTMHNADLCDTLGNLVHRATNLCDKFCAGVVPDVPPPAKMPIDFNSIRETFINKLDNFELDAGASLAIAAFRDVNGFLTEAAPWHLKGDEHEESRQIIVRAVLESVYALAHLLVPYIPEGAEKIFLKLNTPPTSLLDLKADLRNLRAGTKVLIGEVLYAKLVSEEELSASEAAKKKAAELAESQARKKIEKERQQEASRAGIALAEGSDDQPDFTKLDIRVGQIVKAWHHEDANKLFCELIDVGESEPRAIASGLREFYQLEKFQSKKVLVVCNLKASKIVGFSSNGMVLAAKNADGSKVELIVPPEESKVGERVFIEGLEGSPFSSAQVKKKKIMENVALKLRTGENCVAMWDGNAIMTSAGPCAAATLIGASIS